MNAITEWTTGTVLLFSVAACGGSGPGAPGDGTSPESAEVPATASSPSTDAFLGEWNCSLTQVTTCATGSREDHYVYTANIIPGATPSTILTSGGTVTDTTTGITYPEADNTWIVSGDGVTLQTSNVIGVAMSIPGGTWITNYFSASGTVTGQVSEWSGTGGGVVTVGYETYPCSFTQVATCTAQ